MESHARLYRIAGAFALLAVPALAAAEQQYTTSDGQQDLDVPFVPTPSDVVDEMLALAQVGKDDVVYDLGSGDGRLVITAAQRFGARGMGVDLDPDRISEARENARRARLGQTVSFRKTDLFTVDLRPATVLTLYLLPEVNLRLRPRILRDMRPGARVTSHEFDMGDWEPDAESKVAHRMVYLWIVPARVAGTWQWAPPGDEDAGRHVMAIEQKYQKLSGKMVGAAARNGASARPQDLTLQGDLVTFSLVESRDDRPSTVRYTGRVNGERIVGTAEVPTTEGSEPPAETVKHAWTATLRR